MTGTDADTIRVAVKTGTLKAACGTRWHPLDCPHEWLKTDSVSTQSGPGDCRKQTAVCADCSGLVVRHYKGDGPADDPTTGWGPWRVQKSRRNQP